MDINYHMPEGGYNQAISNTKGKVIHPKIHSHVFSQPMAHGYQ
jgi:hypothetical protein